MMQDHKISQKFTLSANGITIPANVAAADFRHIALFGQASGGADFSIRVRASRQETPPDFTSASTASNNWFYPELVNSSDGTFYAGDTGYVVAANGALALDLNEDVITWVALEVFGYTAGTFEGWFIFKNNA